MSIFIRNQSASAWIEGAAWVAGVADEGVTSTTVATARSSIEPGNFAMSAGKRCKRAAVDFDFGTATSTVRPPTL